MRPSIIVAFVALLCPAAQGQSVSLVSSSGAPVSFVVPLGIEAPDGAVSAFRVEATLPAGIIEHLAKTQRQLNVRIETELVPTVPAAPMPNGHPRTTITVPLRSIAHLHPELRFQRGANRLQSPVIVAIADPRASVHYVWPSGANKVAEGCANCDRPSHLVGKSEADGVYELFTAGRHIAVGIAPGVVDGTPYAWLAQNSRMQVRVGTIIADTIRPPAIRVAANAPPVAGGMLQETTYLHSGELETSAAELGIARTYRSGTLGFSPIGAGWDADIFRRLRALPNGDVEYRDGAETWLFRLAGNDYQSPVGLFLRLARTTRGWTLIDQKQRETRFDALGRLETESDEFFDPRKPGSGNTTTYLYRSDGRLARIVDAYGRETTLTWTGGLLTDVADWRSRRVTYRYDAQRRLEHVDLPEVAPHKPRIDYTYAIAGSSLEEQLELAPNLLTIRDPNEAAKEGPMRVTFGYTADRVTSQRWATGESATVTYLGPANVNVTDVLGQERRYVVSANDTANLLADRAHVTEMRETSVPVWSVAPFGQLPPAVQAGAPTTASAERVTRYTFENGVLKSSKLDGVGETTMSYETASGGPGLVLKSTTSAPLTTGGGGGSSILPAPAPITRTFHYQPGSTFMESVEANGRHIAISDPHRYKREPLTTNDAIAEQQKFDERGRLSEVTSSGGTDAVSAGAKSGITYYPDSAALHARGRPHVVTEGEGEQKLVTTYEYPTAQQTREIDPRKVTTTTDVDAWDRPVRVRVERAGDPLVLEQSYEYDATGRLQRSREKKGAEVVTTSYEYDVMGRRKSTTRDGIATVGVVTATTEWNLPARRIITTSEGGAVTTRELDALGRIVRSVTETGSSPVEQRFAYDLAGNRVFTTDMVSAAASAFDVHGRQIGTRNADGTVDLAEYDEWNRVKNAKSLDSKDAPTAESSYAFTAAGRLQSVQTRVDGEVKRESAFAWDGGGRTTRTATSGRATSAAYDIAGRFMRSEAGAGDLNALQEIFARSIVKSHSGALPAVQETAEKSGPDYETTATHNVAADVTKESIGTLEWQRTYDELGNVTDASVPNRPATKWDVDARGAVKKETLADGAENEYAYDKSGAQSGYVDPGDEPTSTVRDRIGRPLERTYADGTKEVVEWEGPRVKSVTDRQARKQTYVYNDKAQLAEIRDGDDRVLDRFAYDDAGRMQSWTTADTEVTWSDFDLDGNPRRTSQRRFRNASGLNASPVLLDEHEQQHRWNEHGERVRFSMPTAPGAVLGGDWTKWLRQRYDAMGNVIEIARIADEFDLPGQGVTLMTGEYRGAGRPDVRTLMTPDGPIVRTYGYDEKTSQLDRVEVKARGVVVAGSETAYDGLQIAEARMLGVSSGTRAARFAYDARSRLEASVFGTKSAAPPTVPVPGRTKEELSAADFRRTQERKSQLDEPTLSVVRAKGVDTTKVDPPTATFDEKPGGGHKIEKVTKGPVVQPFGWNGAERVDDGRFVYQFDARGRLVKATEKTAIPPVRRILYSYTGSGRMVGRRAEYANVASPGEEDWKLEDRATIIANDALPADTTFVWDPITDRLLSVFAAGNPSAPLKQIIHGDLAYDDPLETTTPTERLYPIYDEAAAGGLQLVLNTRAEVVARNLPNDPYGAHDLSFVGAAIDGAGITASKTAITISLHATEQLSPSTIVTGVRLAAVDASGSLVRVSSSTPSLTDAYTVSWTLTPGELSTLTAAPAVSLSIAATSTLRATAWSSDVPVMPAPEWALASKPVYTSPSLPFEVRESLASLASFLATIPETEERTTAIYEVETLALLASPSRPPSIASLSTASFQALPFVEAPTGLIYARARWYDPGTGSFLSPDPMGYRDSSNLYAFAGGDPVNGRDPTGEEALPQATPKVPLPPDSPPGKVLPFPRPPAPSPAPPVRFGGPAVSVGLVINWVINKGAEFVEEDADRYVEQSQQRDNEIKVEAAKRRNDGSVLSPVSSPATAGQTNPGGDCGSTPTLILKYRILGNTVEFIRQLAGQESGFRRMTAGQIKANIEAYRSRGGRPPAADRAAAAARRANPDQAAGRSGLHNPDPCVGGDSTLVEDFGDSRENSSIGAQNRWKIDRIYDYVSRLRPDSRVDIKLIAQ